MSGTEPSGVNGHAKPTARPVALQGDLANLPEALAPLKVLPNWVCWKCEWRVDKNGDGSWTKPPFRPQGGYAKNNDPATWCSYERGRGGVSRQVGLTASVSTCSAPTSARSISTSAAIPSRARSRRRQWRSSTARTPTRKSRRQGTGLRVIGTSSGRKVHRKQKLPGSTVQVESYRNAARYITVTGNPLPTPRSTWSRLAL